MFRISRIVPIIAVLAFLLGSAYIYFANQYGPTQEVPVGLPDEFFDGIPIPIVEPPSPAAPLIDPPPAIIDPPVIEPPPVINPPPPIIEPDPVVELPIPVPPVVEPQAPPVVIRAPPPAADPPIIEPPIPAPMSRISFAVFNSDGSSPIESGAAIRMLVNGEEDYYLSCNNTCSIEFPTGTSLAISGEWFGIPVVLSVGPNYLTTLTDDASLDLNFAVYDDPDHRGRIAFENTWLDVLPFYGNGFYQLQVTAEGTVPMRFQILDSSLEPRLIELNGVPYQATSNSILKNWNFNILTRVLSADIQFQSTWTIGIGWQSGAPNLGGNNNPQNINPLIDLPNGNPPNIPPEDDVYVDPADECANNCEEGQGEVELIIDGSVPEFGGSIALLTSAIFSVFLLVQLRRSKAYRATFPTSSPQ